MAHSSASEAADLNKRLFLLTSSEVAATSLLPQVKSMGAFWGSSGVEDLAGDLEAIDSFSSSFFTSLLDAAAAAAAAAAATCVAAANLSMRALCSASKSRPGDEDGGDAGMSGFDVAWSPARRGCLEAAAICHR